MNDIIKSLKALGLDYVDSIMIIDADGRIDYSVRYNPRFNKSNTYTNLKKYINRHILEAYPSLNVDNSTFIKCLQEGVPVYCDNQIIRDMDDNRLNTCNLTVPIVKSGRVIGAIELSKDITSIDDISRPQAYSYSPNYRSAVSPAKNMYVFKDIITCNRQMLQEIERAKMVAGSRSMVLVYGETGTGKELFVQAIHSESDRRNKPFIVQNCAAIPPNLFESILFGSVKGAFTGAENHVGLFEAADGGSLCLDELNSMPLEHQAKLLRVIQDGTFHRVGETRERKADVRIMTTMNINPLDAVRKNIIREDLFYRLNVINIRLVPLRQRKEDIALYVRHFIHACNKEMGKEVVGVSLEVEKMFMAYDWPGNVREIQHVIEASMNIVQGDLIEVRHLPVYLIDFAELDFDKVQSGEPAEGMAPLTEEPAPTGSLNEEIEQLERRMIREALVKSGGNVSKAARLLDVPRQTIQYKMEKYHIEI